MNQRMVARRSQRVHEYYLSLLASPILKVVYAPAVETAFLCTYVAMF